MLQDGFELPTRLAVSAADCILVLSEALGKKPIDSRSPREKGSLGPNPSNKPISILEKHGEKKDMSPSVSNNVEGVYLLWQLLDQLIILVEKLHSVSMQPTLFWLVSRISFILLTQDVSLCEGAVNNNDFVSLVIYIQNVDII